ncbi:Hypothetical predicted protein [Mytilus galloprovincialis]|uniref:CCHC-type domain-containing protein n=1 Tax=Mytilus galloprovincialis TaxID=29158 RepID=A0A8B6EZN5_MYTGA|nr:Hypothetical predicted protein [Mytilus galloprovincialis]
MIKFEQKPCTFDGVSADVQDYFIQFEAVSLWNNWNFSEMALQLVINLREEARTILPLLTPTQLQSYDFLKSLLMKRFNPKERIAFLKFQLNSCTILQDESVFDFGHGFKLLCHRAYPDHFHSMQSYFMDLFIGKLEKEMGKFVHFKYPATFDDVIFLGTEFESFNLTIEPVECEIEESEESLDLSCLKSGFNQIFKVLKKLVYRKFKVKKCFNCSVVGHIRANCPNKVCKSVNSVHVVEPEKPGSTSVHKNVKKSCKVVNKVQSLFSSDLQS